MASSLDQSAAYVLNRHLNSPANPSIVAFHFAFTYLQSQLPLNASIVVVYHFDYTYIHLNFSFNAPIVLRVYQFALIFLHLNSPLNAPITVLHHFAFTYLYARLLEDQESRVIWTSLLKPGVLWPGLSCVCPRPAAVRQI